MQQVKISDAVGYVKTQENKAVINTDLTSLEAYRKSRDFRKRGQETINTLRDENAELKSLLKHVINCAFNMAAITNDELIEIERKSKAHI